MNCIIYYPIILNVKQIYKNLNKLAFGFLWAIPSNCTEYWIIPTVYVLISKLFTAATSNCTLSSSPINYGFLDSDRVLIFSTITKDSQSWILMFWNVKTSKSSLKLRCKVLPISQSTSIRPNGFALGLQQYLGRESNKNKVKMKMQNRK